ncbi:hypothetical protein HYDPIDRAFT_168356 [Hydnomerulius pinastri MD-312]|uniref:F-box domain-containing protein n=1 Tax=Hydnomerulius pinastri MD-312 TaxID=994086 RepID=A0A0C9W807_9AGAM|nr:hypothetical protein HYDPIDRAFT_168356 [Hydnomerulius pinastri MD-312]
MSLHALPYDLLFNIAQYLDIDDVHHLQATCKSLRSFTLTRPVYRSLAHALLARSRPLPLPAFQRLADLSTQNLIKAVDRAHRFEKAWRVRAPKPARSSFSLSASGSTSCDGQRQWYTKISAPPNEEIDWLSPITSSYTLCATKSGRVVCWDVARDICLAEWDPRTLAAQLGAGDRTLKDGRKERMREMKGDEDDDEDDDSNVEKKWELWKCRVEFDERAVYFTMARVLEGSYDDNRVMEFVLMKLAFPPERGDHRTPASSPLSQLLSFAPESHYWTLSKSPATSPPSSQTSSPQDSTLLTASTGATSTQSSPMSSLTTLPNSSDCAGCDPETTYPKICPCPSASLCSPFPVTRSLSASTSPRAPFRSTLATEYPPMEPTPDAKPIFFPLTSFHTTGVVMNVFLLDPPRRLLSAFVWVASSNTIGLYVLLDWAKDEYVFVDTSVGCLISSNWSCILHEDQIVIHSEEADAAYQHFYPLSVLRTFAKPRRHNLTPPRERPPASTSDTAESSDRDPPHFHQENLPTISIRLPPVKSISKKFVFPSVVSSTVPVPVPDVVVTPALISEAVGDEAHDDSSDIEIEQSSAGLPLPAAPEGQLDADANDGEEASVDDGNSDYETGEDELLVESAEGHLIAKGKGRAIDEDEGAELAEGDELDPPCEKGTSQGAKGKGKMREVEPEEEEPEAEGAQTGSSSQTLSAASPQNSPVAIQPSPSTAVVSNGATAPPQNTAAPAPNPYPFPPWYPESAHFVRQWWPTLPGVPRLSCTVVLLAAHDPDTHRTRFVLAQHYFRVPIMQDPPEASSSSPKNVSEDDEMLHLWYVSTPFEVVCVMDSAGENDDDDEAGDRPRPLVAVDFGHAVWVEYAGEPGGVYGVDASRLVEDPAFAESDDEEEDGIEDDEDLFDGMSDGSTSPDHASTNPHDGDGTIFDPRRHRVPKCLRFVTFPPVFTALDSSQRGKAREEAVVRTLEIPEELDLDGVETINIDQSQGAVILSVKEGKIFILRYE